MGLDNRWPISSQSAPLKSDTLGPLDGGSNAKLVTKIFRADVLSWPWRRASQGGSRPSERKPANWELRALLVSIDPSRVYRAKTYRDGELIAIMKVKLSNEDPNCQNLDSRSYDFQAAKYRSQPVTSNQLIERQRIYTVSSGPLRGER